MDNNNLRLTTRGKIVLAALIVLVTFGVNHLIAGKNLACDWRSGISACSIETERGL